MNFVRIITKFDQKQAYNLYSLKYLIDISLFDM
jgi:hypothetical protein